MTQVVALNTLATKAAEWYTRVCEPHSGEASPAEQVLLYALELGMPEQAQGDADGFCLLCQDSSFHVLGFNPNDQSSTPPEWWVAAIAPAGMVAENYTPEQIVAEFSVLVINPAMMR